MSLNKKYVSIAIIYMLFIFALSSISVEDNGSTRNLITETINNLLHIPLFGLLAFLWIKAFDNKKVQLNKMLIYSLIITLCYAAFDEFHQSFVPGRNASLGDFAMDALGCIATIYLYRRKVK